MERLRWGILSTAKIGVEQVIPGIRDRAERGEVYAIASRYAGRAAAAAEQLGIPQSYGSYEELLADPDVDAVYNPLPNHLHAPLTMQAADAGKHVLCEKPLALDTPEAQRMVDHCAAAGVKLQEAFMYRFHPQWQKTKELVDANAIGDLVAVQTWFSYFNRDPDNIRNVPEWGGGALMDIGCYPISVARWLFGAEPDVVEGTLTIDPDFGTDATASGLLRFGPGQSTFTVSMQAEPFQQVQVVGTRGRIEVEMPFNPRPDAETRINVTTRGNPPGASDTVTLVFDPADHYALQADAFAAAVQAGESVPTPPSDAVANMRVIEAVRGD